MMESSGTILLECENVVKRYGSLSAVDGMSLTVSRGEIVGIGGPNGAGKTTFFDVVTGVTPATEGRMIFDGHDISGLGADRICQHGIARTFQLNAAFDSLTVRENIDVAAYFGRSRRTLPGLRLGRDVRDQTEEALAFVGLADKADATVAQLPVLDRKLLMIAGAIATRPKLLFLDEPVGGLNTSEIDHIIRLVERLKANGMTVVLIEHVMRFLLALSSRVLIMHHGKKIFEGPPQAVAEDPVVVETYLGEGTRKRLKTYFSEGEVQP
ncbi:branched-chain amino acid ABC transporter ATP-binding protein [Shinella sp. SUS2]|jgi:ABC-type branched-subunit amino acid transport system ATPase component|uniref:ABC transporter ATP-binding protein n=1 Tax=unclassified Shinella TaxID=2643062 RepID=UPI00067FD776|nr:MULTISPECIES: ABC transporter ATP-binding protein [unclassified Shinella]KNY14179.1 branched-chain amino acid ABC transporter ATP-binding protein [Shinella sp. SUS2]KOC74009.1 branched-chain amino acid ABC transporter ATP-binding protein [Shinella sp. GWS1]